MHVLLDLDGTLVDTNEAKFEDMKFGRVQQFACSDIPSIRGSEEFVEDLRRRGHSVTIVSDSHATYVGPLAKEKFGCAFLALSDKPNTVKLRDYLKREFGFPSRQGPEEFLFVGDTMLDVQLARGLSIPSVRLDMGLANCDQFDNQDKIRKRRYLEGATYNCRSFAEILEVLDSPAKHRLVLEDTSGTAVARLYSGRNNNDGVTLIRGLGRQQQGPCDKYGVIDRYYKFGSEERSSEFVQRIAGEISCYLNNEVLLHGAYRWDLITCVADKATTMPPHKMAALLHALDIGLPKLEVFRWSSEVTGSIRNEKKRYDRAKFINRFVSLNDEIELRGKNVIVIDDQYTTGATAMAHAEMLLRAGVCNVLFVALFYLTNEVQVEKICPKCGRIMRIKYRKRDGEPFYSCVSPKYNGDGCGWMGNIDSGN